MKYYFSWVSLFVLLTHTIAFANTGNTPSTEKKVIPRITMPSKIVEYKHVGDISLNLHIFNPKAHQETDNRPAIVFFHGGGWNSGTPRQFYRQSKYLADRGMVAISAEYRLVQKHYSTPKESVKDGKSAMRWIRAHAKELGINPNMIAAGGGSAGGQIAAATGTATTMEEAGENTALSYCPQALVLFNPVFDNGPDGYGHQRVADYWQQFSPLHNITKNTPATIGFFGDKDTVVKIQSALNFQEQMRAVGAYFELHIYKDQPHSFFNKAKYHETVLAMDKFLQAQGFLQ